MKAIINGKIITPNSILKDKVLIFNEKIIGFYDSIPNDFLEDIEIIDAMDNYVSPGLIDIHTHGNSGYDFMGANTSQIKSIEEFMLSKGVTSYLATTMTMDKKNIVSALNTIKEHIKNGVSNGAKALGVHLEGPFLNEKYKGAQDPKYIIAPTIDLINDYLDIIKVITYAPENDSNLDFTKHITSDTDIVLSMGHTNATYYEASNAINNGAKHATHLFNAMTGLNHRDPGVVGASLLNESVSCEIIADNIHINKDLYNMIVKLKGISGIILVTDSMEATGMKDGVYSIGGHPVQVKDNAARLVSNNALAGSTLTLNRAIKNFFDNTTLDLNEVINMASLNPARSLNIDSKKGSLEIGKDSDICIFDKDMNCLKGIVNGDIKYINKGDI